MRINHYPENIRSHICFFCPECKNKMFVLGISDQVFWCNNCKTAYYLEFRKTQFTEKELRDVIGFPK